MIICQDKALAAFQNRIHRLEQRAQGLTLGCFYDDIRFLSVHDQHGCSQTPGNIGRVDFRRHSAGTEAADAVACSFTDFCGDLR